MLNTFYQKRKRKLFANLKECERVYQSCIYPIILTQYVQHLKNRIDGIPIATEVLLMESYNTWLRIFIVFWYMQRSTYVCVCVCVSVYAYSTGIFQICDTILCLSVYKYCAYDLRVHMSWSVNYIVDRKNIVCKYLCGSALLHMNTFGKYCNICIYICL